MKLSEYIEQRGNVEIDPAEMDKLLGVKTRGQKPNVGDRYWYLDDMGMIHSTFWYEYNIDNYRYYTDNCFLSEEAAQLKLIVIETEIKLRQYAEKHNDGVIDWGNDQQLKWYLAYGCLTDEVSFNVTLTVCICNQIYFTSYTIAQNAIAEIGENQIKKYLKYGSGIDTI